MKYSRFLCGSALVTVMIKALDKASFVETHDVSLEVGSIQTLENAEFLKFCANTHFGCFLSILFSFSD